MAQDSYSIDHGFKALLGALDSLDGTVIKVGIQADAADVPSVEDAHVSVLDKAVYNEFGTENIPARPFVATWADTKEKEIHEHLEAAYLAIIDKGISPEVAAKLVGEWAQNDMRVNLREFPWAPNAPATVKKKGSDKPLIDESQMVNSIRYLTTRDFE